MSLLEDLKAKWDELDEVDRRNIGYGLVGLALLILLLISLSDTWTVLDRIAGRGAAYANESIGGLDQVGDVITGST